MNQDMLILDGYTIEGDIQVDKQLVIRGVVVGSITVVGSGVLTLLGTCTQNLVVEKGAEVYLSSMTTVMGDVFNCGGYLEIHGAILGSLHTESGNTIVDYGARYRELNPGSFYCVYCNRIRSGKRGTLEEKTQEHFIPQSIGGKWHISVCDYCNSVAGSSCDAFFAQVSWTHRFFKDGIVETDGTARFLDGSEADVHFSYQEKGDHRQLHLCRELASGMNIPQKEIRSIKFKMPSWRDTRNTYPAIAKMALGGTYYLVRRYGEWSPATEAFFSNLYFADIRRLFLGRRFRPGGKGRGLGCTIEAILPPETGIILRSRKSPSIRRHYMSVEDADSGLQVVLCLYSHYFWRVTIPRLELGLGKLEDEIILNSLSPVDWESAGALPFTIENAYIELFLAH